MLSDSIRRRGIFKNPLQRYKNILGYANFEAQKVKFFDENCAFSCTCHIFVVPLQAQNLIYMKTKLFTLFFALVASVGSIFADGGTCGENLTWDLTDGVLTISGTGEMMDYSSGQDVPWYGSRSSINSLVIDNNITSIGAYAFSSCYLLESVTIPAGVMSINEYAFSYCSCLLSVTISNKYTSIAPYAFFFSRNINKISFAGDIDEWCSKSWEPQSLSSSYDLYIQDVKVTDLVIPNSVTSIKKSAFYGCKSMTSIVIPNSVTSIEISAFDRCTSLTSVVVPNSVTCIKKLTFHNCTNLTSIVIPNSVTSIEESAFEGCSSMTSFVIPNSVNNIGIKAFCDCTGLTSVVISNSITSIADYAFLGCSNLVSLIIPNSVTNVGRYAFKNCTGLTSVTIPNSVISIGRDAFVGCSNLTAVHISDLSAWCRLYFEEYDGGTLRTNPLIYAHNLYLNDELVSDLVIPEDITTILTETFAYCTSLQSVTIPNSVTSIGLAAFYHCSSLASLNIGKNITEIGTAAFRDCSELTSLTIPNKVRSIGNMAFGNCTGLQSVTCLALTPPSGFNEPFYYVDCSQIPLYVPAVSVQDYNDAYAWRDFNPIIGIDIQEEAINEVESNDLNYNKILRDGQILIHRGDKTYTLQGQEVR